MKELKKNKLENINGGKVMSCILVGMIGANAAGMGLGYLELIVIQI